MTTATPTKVATIQNCIDGHWVTSSARKQQDVVNPATGEVLARVPLSETSEVERAVNAAAGAYPAWKETPPEERIQYLFKLKNLLEEHFEELARSITIENGKTLTESKGELRRAIENVEV